MKILAVMQNQWFHDPAKVKAILEDSCAQPSTTDAK